MWKVGNRTKSMKNKLDATEKQPLTVTETGGGVKLELNTGFYELFKSAAEEFYSSDNRLFFCTKVPVKDKTGANVETKYKVTEGKDHLCI